MSSKPPLLDVTDLTVEYPRGRRKPPLRALDAVSLAIEPGETVGLVGESGSGKSTLGRAVLGLVPARSGTIRFDGRDITHAAAEERRRLSADLQAVFQDPYSSLNPARTVRQTLAEPLGVHERLSRAQTRERVEAMLRRVGLPADAAERYPRHFSGGQRQRIAIARALMLSPRLVISDEAVSALDLSIQAQILNLLLTLQEELSLSYLFISHDLAVVRHLSHRVVVLYRGEVVESGPTAQVCDAPTHPYTRGLLASAPVADPAVQRKRRGERGAENGYAGTAGVRS
ncbi:MAG: hypothetical protein V7607_5592 [Solirubrobacteraceae bacterium]